ncbi:uncharacterized protein LOC143860618 [Tasmannia lanceolata]|uniref:uncharacterized protein LOC143860618 n=1 Tax=Tasmannia lanceolata TaxID=3420 RepID=UPI004063007E
MASGSSGRTASSSREFDFGTDDDLGKQEPSNVIRTDPANPKDFWDSRMGRPSVDVYNRKDESRFQDVIATVEKTMKKYADNLLRFLEGISGRLSQLEAYCYNLEQSIRELQSDLNRDHNESDMKLRSLEKHLQEVHRSIQILRDKQELADTQRELAKLHLVRKESTTTHQNEDGVVSSASEPRKHDMSASVQSQQLALALPHQAPTPTSLPVRVAENQHQPYKELTIQQLPPPSLPQPQTIHVQSQPPNAYYSQQTQLPSQPPQTQQHQQDQYVPQMQNLSRQAPQTQPHVNQTQTHQFPSYQHPWPQQSPQQVQPQEPSTQAQIRPQIPPVYPPYAHQPANPLPETFQGSMPMQVFSGISQSGVNHPDAVFYGYGSSARTVPPQSAQPNIQHKPQPQTIPGTFGAHTPQPNIPGYMMYDTNTVGRPHPQHFQQGGYLPTHASALPNQQPPTGNVAVHRPSSQLVHNHPYSELVEKAMNRGYARDHVLSVILRMEESGQPLDFNALLDRLNAHATGTSQRVWSG